MATAARLIAIKNIKPPRSHAEAAKASSSASEQGLVIGTRRLKLIENMNLAKMPFIRSVNSTISAAYFYKEWAEGVIVMNIKRFAAVASLTLSMAAFAPVALAQMGEGAPAPGGAALSGAAPSGHAGSLSNYNPMKQIPPQEIKHEREARKEEASLGRQLAEARLQGLSVSNAEAKKNAGSVALSHGDRMKALHEFHQAEQDIQTARNPSNNMNGTNATNDGGHPSH